MNLSSMPSVNLTPRKARSPLSHWFFLIILLPLILSANNTPDDYPSIEITNGLIRAKLYTPDIQSGFYRSSRFDWSGVMPELEYKGHSYFGEWYAKYDPSRTDAIMGPVEEFTPVGYDSCIVGDTFLKIGVGMLTKTSDAKYAFPTAYPIVNSGTWEVKTKKSQVEFVQKLNDPKYAYEYHKTVQLIKGKPEMVLSHSLKNTGPIAIETSLYDHNFFVIDKQPSGPDFTITFPFKPTGDAGTTASFGFLRDNQILYQKGLTENYRLQFRSLEGFGNSAEDYDIRIENHKTGAAVRITSDQPISKLAFWSVARTICPEPYIQFKINPGETFKWRIFYEFYLCDTESNNESK